MSLLLREGTVNNDGCVFRAGFRLRREEQDQSGVFVGCTVGRYGPGIMPTAASSRVTYDNTRALLINQNKMTVRAKFRTPAALGAATYGFIAKSPNSLLDNQFFLQFHPGFIPAFFIANAPGDFGQYIYTNAALLASTLYVMHFVYDGTLAAASRGAIYSAGLAVASSISGTLPVTMRASASPLTIFNRDAAAGGAPPTDFTLFDCAIWNRAFSPSECLSDALDQTFGGA